MLTIMTSYWDQYATDAQFPRVINSQISPVRPRTLRQVREIGMTGNVTSKTLASRFLDEYMPAVTKETGWRPIFMRDLATG